MVGGEKLMMFVALKLACFSYGPFYSSFPNYLCTISFCRTDENWITIFIFVRSNFLSSTFFSLLFLPLADSKAVCQWL
jgi:hypothetical protein